MNLCWATLHVADLGRSLHFYGELLGLPLARRFNTPHAEIAMLGEGENALLELIADGTPSEAKPGQGVSLGLPVRSLEGTTELLRKGGVAVPDSLFSPNPHLRFLFVKDPDGYQVQLVENR